MNILIAGAWPYANGPLHLGHIASLLPGDVLARYYRAKGETVVYVSGSDCYGTPVALRARQEGRRPEEICEAYHEDFIKGFEYLGFSYDIYGKTTQPEHRSFVQTFHRELYRRPYVYEKTEPQAYCPSCKTFLSDRFVVGECPQCGAPSRGDQCDVCGCVPEPAQLKTPACTLCGTACEVRESKQLALKVSALEPELRALLDTHPNWRKNACAFTRRYLEEGLRDRSITRELYWGIPVPRAGYTHQCIYIWAENVLGYLSMSKLAAGEQGIPFDALWGENARHYYVHGKDNIPFHTLILPALLLAHGQGWRLPDDIVSSEHLTLEGKKLSTSRNWAVWVKDLIGSYEPDSIRYALIANGSEKRDADFSWQAYVRAHNGELLGAYGNFVNRTLAFIERTFGGAVPQGVLPQEQAARIHGLYPRVGDLIEQGACKEALLCIFEEVRAANRFFDTQRPWAAQPSDCGNTLFACVQLIANFAVLLAPFLPFSSAQVFQWLGLTAVWEPQWVAAGTALPPIKPLFRRLPPETAEQEIERLRQTRQPTD